MGKNKKERGRFPLIVLERVSLAKKEPTPRMKIHAVERKKEKIVPNHSAIQNKENAQPVMEECRTIINSLSLPDTKESSSYGRCSTKRKCKNISTISSKRKKHIEIKHKDVSNAIAQSTSKSQGIVQSDNQEHCKRKDKTSKNGQTDISEIHNLSEGQNAARAIDSIPAQKEHEKHCPKTTKNKTKKLKLDKQGSNYQDLSLFQASDKVSIDSLPNTDKEKEIATTKEEVEMKQEFPAVPKLRPKRKREKKKRRKKPSLKLEFKCENCGQHFRNMNCLCRHSAEVMLLDNFLRLLSYYQTYDVLQDILLFDFSLRGSND